MAELKVVPIERIDIPDVRVSSILDEEQKALLASTVKEIGVVQDIVVRRKGADRYELVAGNLEGRVRTPCDWVPSGGSIQKSLVTPKGRKEPAHRA